MGYRRNSLVFPLDFPPEMADAEGNKLEVIMRRPSIDGINNMAQLSNIDPLRMTTEDLQRVAQMFKDFIACLVSWNIEHDVLDADGRIIGTVPVPADAEGVRSQDDDFILLIIHEWMTTLLGTKTTPEDIPQEPIEATGVVLG